MLYMLLNWFITIYETTMARMSWSHVFSRPAFIWILIILTTACCGVGHARHLPAERQPTINQNPLKLRSYKVKVPQTTASMNDQRLFVHYVVFLTTSGSPGLLSLTRLSCSPNPLVGYWAKNGYRRFYSLGAMKLVPKSMKIACSTIWRPQNLLLLHIYIMISLFFPN